MKTNHIDEKAPTSKSGFLLFYVMGTLALLSLAAMISLNSARLESRTARNHYDATRAMYHAEAGVTLTKAMVEKRLQMGEPLSSILATLKVSPPNGVDFDEISEFREIVPERIFSFESIGRSNDAKASVVVQYRRKPIYTVDLFGYKRMLAQNHVSIYGYDSRLVKNPTPADNNGGASIGSNYEIRLANERNFTFNGSILLGETGEGLDPDCRNCTSSDYTLVHVGYVEKDPLGLLDSDSAMSNEFDAVANGNNNNTAMGIQGTVIDLGPHDELKLEAGDYYFTDISMRPGSSLIIDNTHGEVRIFLDGKIHMRPKGIFGTDDSLTSPQDFRILSRSSQEIRINPMGDLTVNIYAPDAHVLLLPNGDFKGNVWAYDITLQPGGDIMLDTSNSDRNLSNVLELHSWYEQQGTF
ncbi:MAG: hypothetical protein JJU29_21295 [Verrucomicrobia bacterium]|nr:hypothetical protein [Verrucomicrobiota bacterium]MCH8510452.1 hypothetical protein [Kiritimatiellia bacterium]